MRYSFQISKHLTCGEGGCLSRTESLLKERDDSEHWDMLPSGAASKKNAKDIIQIRIMNAM